MRLAAIVALAALSLMAAPAAWSAGRCGSHPWCDASLDPDTRAGMLLTALTEDEKIGLLAGDDLFGVLGREGTHTGTSDGVERLDVPTVYFSDGPVGSRQGKATALPIPMALAATFDPLMARLHGMVIADEVRKKGNDVVFAPTVNILRTPLWGRAFETYGEDPYLTARLAVGWIQAAQHQGVIASVKHFAANNQEGAGPAAALSRPGQPVGPPGVIGNRLTVDVRADERTLREIYLPHFEAAVREAGAGSIMCSYNRLNGPWACENEHLLERVLKDDWGFEGFVLADYGAAKTAFGGLANGLDFDPWPGVAYTPALVKASLAASLASPADVDEHVRRILRTLFAFGAFDREAYRDDDAQIDKAAHLRDAQTIEESAITLLENDGLLPLDPAGLRRIALIGSDADSFKTGGGSANVSPYTFISPREAITERAGSGVEVAYDDGSDAARAAELAEAADVAIVFASDYQTEFTDRECLSLQCPAIHGDQDALIERVAAANPRTVVVLETGGPVLTPWRGEVGALLEAWYPGAAGGAAIARVLFGDVDPGGRLPATFPRSEADLPTSGDPEAYPGVAETVRFKEGVLVGYRWFDARGTDPAYPFGFGLSYTTFAQRGLRVTPGEGASASVSVQVENTGARAGTEVVQLYLGLPEPRPGVVQPPRQLRGFAKVALEPGERRRVRFELDERSFAYWDVHGDRWRVAPGCYRVEVGRSSRHIERTATIALGGGSCP